MTGDPLPRSVERTLLLELLKDHAAPMTGRLKHERCHFCSLLGVYGINIPAAREKLANE